MDENMASSGEDKKGPRKSREQRELMNSLRVHPDTKENARGGSVRAALTDVTIPGDFAQFGVFKGSTARIIESLMTGDRKLHLFDSFEGLPEDWSRKQKAGAFKLSEAEIPVFRSERVVLHKGWFSETVPEWAAQATAPLAFVHLDADLYSSTVDALFNIDRLILKDTILLFDEYGRTDHEHRALLDWSAKFDRKFEYLWRSVRQQVCVRVN